MKRFIVFLVAFAAVITLVPTVASAKVGTLSGLYNARYCEIFTVTMPEPPSFQVDVYNTVGLNDCPAEKWAAVNFDTVKAEVGSIGAGPMVLDVGLSTQSPAVKQERRSP